VIETLGEYDEHPLSKLGPRIRVDYGGDTGREWLRGLVTDLADDGLVTLDETGDELCVSLRE